MSLSLCFGLLYTPSQRLSHPEGTEWKPAEGLCKVTRLCLFNSLTDAERDQQLFLFANCERTKKSCKPVIPFTHFICDKSFLRVVNCCNKCHFPTERDLNLFLIELIERPEYATVNLMLSHINCVRFNWLSVDAVYM